MDDIPLKLPTNTEITRSQSFGRDESDGSTSQPVWQSRRLYLRYWLGLHDSVRAVLTREYAGASVSGQRYDRANLDFFPWRMLTGVLDWRRGENPSGERQVLSLFADDPRAPFSIHRFVEHGAEACGKHPGEWFGPSATALCIQ